jgi:hypothetical protein
VVFVDHTAEYPVASDQAVEGQGGWPVLLAGGALAESLMRAGENCSAAHTRTEP